MSFEEALHRNQRGWFITPLINGGHKTSGQQPSRAFLPQIRGTPNVDRLLTVGNSS